MKEVKNINWDVFSQEEATRLKKAIEDGSVEAIVPVIDTMTQEKEAELQKICSQMSSPEENYENSKLEEYWMNNPQGPQTPAEEAELQKELDNDFNKFKANQEKQFNSQQGNITSKPKEEVKEEPKNEIKKTNNK